MATKLTEEILSKENLERACKAVMSNKGSSGVDWMKVEELPKFIEEHGEEITNRIRQRKYKPLPVRRVEIPKTDGTKRNCMITASEAGQYQWITVYQNLIL